jgi:shikimate kinase / 3-dehydroquinate synthase
VEAARVTARRASSLVFIGFMGAGKTSAARSVAAELGVRAVDADAAIEAHLGSSIEDWFARHGEPAFRETEEQVVVDLLNGAADHSVVSLGGGAVLSERVREALQGHTVIHLDVEPDTAWQRAGGRRPLARDRRRFDELHATRAPLYEAVADAVVPHADREAVRAALPAVRALADAPPQTKLVWARSASGSYPVYLGPRLIGSGFWPVEGARFCVTDEHVGPRYAGRVGGLAHTVTIPAGEQHKTLTTVERVLRELTRAGLDHDGHVVALGGGVVGDLAGFCAAVHQRGVRVVQVPTTLLAQVDSAYGGKTGVDLPEGKNYVGAYHQPSAVMVDPTTLSSLPPAELAAGWAEVVKTALIAGGTLWKRVKDGPAEVDRDLLLACARTKLAVVAEDERDAGRRQVLNLGHTVGHAIETATGYGRYRHGEAVALGLLAALTLSERHGLRADVAELLAARGLPTRLDADVDREAVLAAVGRDKKRRGGRVGFVLLDAPGVARTGRAVSDEALRAAVEDLAR